MNSSPNNSTDPSSQQTQLAQEGHHAGVHAESHSHSHHIYTKAELLQPHHRSVGGGPVRAAVFGMSDGLCSNVSLVLGIAGAAASPGMVRLAGLAGLLAGAFSMAAGEYISMQSQTELLEHELRKERIQLAEQPEFEVQELSAAYQEKGISKEVSDQVAREVMKRPDLALDVHAREELGVDPTDLGSPIGAMVWSFLAFVVGAIVPVVPWFFGGGATALWGSIIATSVFALLLGWIVGKQSGNNAVYTAIRQWGVCAVAAAVTYGVGSLIGGGTGV